MYSYIWIEDEENLNDFCTRRFGEKPQFIETTGHVNGRGSSAKVRLIYKDPADDEPPCSNCHQMYFLYMENDGGEYYLSELDKIKKWSYEKIRADRTAILRKRG